MAKPSQILGSLKKLYDKRASLDKQIFEAEKKLVAEVEKPVKAELTKKPAKNRPPGGREAESLPFRLSKAHSLPVGGLFYWLFSGKSPKFQKILKNLD